MVVIVSALRTAIGKYGGVLKDIEPEELVANVMKNNLAELAQGPEIIDEVILGHTKQSAHNPNIARIAALKTGITESAPAHTVQMQCGSSLQAIMNGWMSIQTGQSEVVLAGGVEVMSQAPYYFVKNRFGIRPGEMTLYDSNIESQPKSQPNELYGEFSMGITAESLADKYAISRKEQDAFAVRSQEKAKKAIEKDRFLDEIVPISLQKKNYEASLCMQDEFPRETTEEGLAKLRPAFKPDGSVTAGNSTGRNDGASTVVMMTEEKAAELKLKPLVKIKSFASAGLSPKEMGLGPVPATKKALEKAGLTLADIDLIELNEAFAAQSLAVIKELGLDEDKVNVNGGAIALGHPLGATGARILTTLIHEMKKENLKYGLATMCIAGGLGVAMVVENL